MSEFKVGDRVKPRNSNSCFSAGTVVGFLADLKGFIKVNLDVVPPIEYHAAGNPCLVIADWFELEEAKP